ncbi:PREDICTED: E3 ubiquitin-protein ligase RNF123-like [Tarenaya hassleriana]|uniref:E3 ubiquitin-protein ligase RNF123-like n=1 Tax=Tarenaya hassleriana TaxID=28532 RepID=UPI00053C21C5|nr:PREDICTED: E3 ubiquitin-protein ligase RNF123-like [Tarenaya hassleriana]XP_010532905.1 PREDICTED: E3 ubiquitin-protein ligase RNF123-like [Tarenaya hassleriana]XP_010532906.1 PREDICTED: E3 ubiquitin-protein ligase RNF123-like [Tarenaya hassleriana]XP_010532907.1 PREDICTED: E3 ubiquitin-protein ligase RNF123-like [Tarenaya hassleriana]
MIQMENGNSLRVTLLDRISTAENRRSSTLEAVLRADERPSLPPPPPPPASAASSPASAVANRTLLDVMRDDRHRNGHGRDKKAWKSLKEKLRLKRSATVWTTPNPIPVEDNLVPDNSDSSRNRVNRLGFLLSVNHEGQSSHSQTTTEEGRLRLREERAVPVRLTDTLLETETPRMSLMELLDDNEEQNGLFGAGICHVDAGDAEEEEAAPAAEEKGCCCVCMVRSKGAAFIPCGHTFCRSCSRELWVQRGSCPLCNASITEILDIF